jgi:tRNA A37 methylthiotransferase MiaB
VAPEEAQERLAALQALQRELTLAYHRGRVGEATEVLVEGPSRRAEAAGGAERQLAGRDPYHRVVNFRAAPGRVHSGERVRVTLVEATPHSLIGELEPAALTPGQSSPGPGRPMRPGGAAAFA